MKFRKSERQEIFEQAQNQTFDILIVGGGTIGAGLALEAISRGLSVILIEKDDFSEEADFESIQLFKGGFQFFKTINFKSFRQEAKEKAILYRNAPHIVSIQKIISPIYKVPFYYRIWAFIILRIYDLLAAMGSQYRGQVLTKSKVIEYFPLLKEQNLKAGLMYYEYKIQDTRLNIENIKKSVELGALALNYVKFVSFEGLGKQKNKVRLYDKLTQTYLDIESKTIIDATRQGLDVSQNNKIPKQSYILPSKGINIVVSHKKVPIRFPLYFELENNVIFFVIPVDKKTYIGIENQDLEKNNIQNNKIDYLLKIFNSYFKTDLRTRDVEQTWGGIRSLKEKKGVNSKEQIIVQSDSVIRVLGEKQITYRLLSEKTIDKVISLLSSSVQFEQSRTRELFLSGANFDFKEIEHHKIVDYVERKFYEAYQLNANTDLINTLFYTYGTNIEKIIEHAFDIYNELEDRSLVWLESEIWYVANYEMLIHLSDFMMRRSNRFYFSNLESRLQMEKIANIMAKNLNWSKEELQQEIDNYNKIGEENSLFVE